MSVDYVGVCDKCRCLWHVGQVFTTGAAFGYGSNDEAGRLRAATWLFMHADCSEGGCRVTQTDFAPPDYHDLDEPAQNRPVDPPRTPGGEPTPCSICGELEYCCPVCGNQMPSRDGRFVHHTGGGGQWICRGSGEALK